MKAFGLCLPNLYREKLNFLNWSMITTAIVGNCSFVTRKGKRDKKKKKKEKLRVSFSLFFFIISSFYSLLTLLCFEFRIRCTWCRDVCSSTGIQSYLNEIQSTNWYNTCIVTTIHISINAYCTPILAWIKRCFIGGKDCDEYITNTKRNAYVEKSTDEPENNARTIWWQKLNV